MDKRSKETLLPPVSNPKILFIADRSFELEVKTQTTVNPDIFIYHGDNFDISLGRQKNS